MKYEVFTNTAEKTKIVVSKTLITLIMMISMVATGLFSYHLFREEAYNGSFLFIIVSYLSIVLTIHVLSSKKPLLQ